MGLLLKRFVRQGFVITAGGVRVRVSIADTGPGWARLFCEGPLEAEILRDELIDPGGKKGGRRECQPRRGRR